MVKLNISGEDGSAVIAFYLIIIVSRSKNIIEILRFVGSNRVTKDSKLQRYGRLLKAFNMAKEKNRSKVKQFHKCK